MRVAPGFAALNRILKKFSQERPAPTAARARAKTFAQLSRPRRLFDSQKVLYFPLRDMKAEAKLVVEVHQMLQGITENLS